MILDNRSASSIFEHNKLHMQYFLNIIGMVFIQASYCIRLVCGNHRCAQNFWHNRERLQFLDIMCTGIIFKAKIMHFEFEFCSNFICTLLCLCCQMFVRFLRTFFCLFLYNKQFGVTLYIRCTYIKIIIRYIQCSCCIAKHLRVRLGTGLVEWEGLRVG